MQAGLPFNPWARPALDAYLSMCGKAADAIRHAGAFGDPEQWRFGWDRRLGGFLSYQVLHCRCDG
jgi:hypothetical protein